MAWASARLDLRLTKRATGGGSSTGFCLIYDDLKSMIKFEPKHRIIKAGHKTKVETSRKQIKESRTVARRPAAPAALRPSTSRSALAATRRSGLDALRLTQQILILSQHLSSISTTCGTWYTIMASARATGR